MINPNAESDKTIEHAEKVEAAVQAAVREALIQHKRAGNPIAVWEEGRVKWIEPEDIEIPEPAVNRDSGFQNE